MANARIQKTVVAAQIRSVTPNGRARPFQVNGRISGTVVNARGYRATTSGSAASGGIVVGNPVGLLLALTYAAAHGGGASSIVTSDFRPAVRIITN